MLAATLCDPLLLILQTLHMTKHGHGLPRKRPGRSAKDAIDAQLPELEPLEDIPELEPIDDLPMLEELGEEELEPLEPVGEDDGPVKATCSESDEEGFDTTVTVDVPDMPKPDVLDAVQGEQTIAERCNHHFLLIRRQLLFEKCENLLLEVIVENVWIFINQAIYTSKRQACIFKGI